MNWREFAVEYLSFTKKDKIAILIITGLIIGVFFLPAMWHRSPAYNVPLTDSNWIASVKRLEQSEPQKEEPGNTDENSNHYQYDQPAANAYKPVGSLFLFDPNTLSEEGWQKLGIRDRTIHTIKNYLSKGGQFRKPEDLQRVYGLFPNEYERIAPYIKIEMAGKATASYSDYSKNNVPGQPAKTVTPRYGTVDINHADTSALIALPGIGSKLAFRIINFRDKLGGFYSINQVGETYGLPDSAFQKIKQYLKLEPSSVKKININTATVDELKAHPYIRWVIAKPLIAYRTEHGLFSNVEDIKKVMAVTEEVYQKILPYLSAQ